MRLPLLALVCALTFPASATAQDTPPAPPAPPAQGAPEGEKAPDAPKPEGERGGRRGPGGQGGGFGGPRGMTMTADEMIGRADADKDGSISKEEFQKDAYENLKKRLAGGNGRVPPGLDTDGDGEVSYEEFCASPMAGERFGRADKNADGKLDKAEIEGMIEEMKQGRRGGRGQGQGQGGGRRPRGGEGEGAKPEGGAKEGSF